VYFWGCPLTRSAIVFSKNTTGAKETIWQWSFWRSNRCHLDNLLRLSALAFLFQMASAPFAIAQG
jgi:hypothetical protein